MTRSSLLLDFEVKKKKKRRSYISICKLRPPVWFYSEEILRLKYIIVEFAVIPDENIKMTL